MLGKCGPQGRVWLFGIFAILKDLAGACCLDGCDPHQFQLRLPLFLMDVTRVKSIRACNPAPCLRAVRSGLTICHRQIVRAALAPWQAHARQPSGAAGCPTPHCANGWPLADAPGALWQRSGGQVSSPESACREGVARDGFAPEAVT